MAKRTFAENIQRTKLALESIKFNIENASDYYGDSKRIGALAGKPIEEYGTMVGMVAGDIAEKQYDKGLGDGKEEAKLEFWRKYLNNGNSIAGIYAFAGYRWNDATFDPPFNIVASGSSNMFCYSQIEDLRGILARNGVSITFLDTTNGASSQHFNIFASAKVKYVPYLKMPSTSSAYGTFNNCTNLKEVDGFDCTERTAFASGAATSNMTFYNNTALEKIFFYGVVANNINMQWSTKLTVASLISLIKSLKDYSGTAEALTRTITLSSDSWTVLANSSEAADELGFDGNMITCAQDVITSKGWNWA